MGCEEGSVKGRPVVSLQPGEIADLFLVVTNLYSPREASRLTGGRVSHTTIRNLRDDVYETVSVRVARGLLSGLERAGITHEPIEDADL